MNSREVFKELDEIVCDSEYPAIKLLLKNEQFLRNLDKICDSKDVCNTKVFRFNESKALEWIACRFQRLRDALVEEGSLHKLITSNGE
ncbi:hypothetical protein TELCIR_07611 [Teladorsagia circumcincta]|uniref:Ribonuclease H2 subunit B wHTH domain-containing protein n=1 Tax=Teladorsagia circumcincta TaxID=45464 RepID=A0A2G9UJU9_TELCI|nr:hypothetical protein TELCIR_07611 [Teladorsagia circumcincta]